MWKVVRRQRTGHRGFTLVELMIVVTIVGVLATAAVPLYTTPIHRAKMSEGIAGVGTIRTAMRIYRATHGAYPSLSSVSGNELSVINVRGSDLKGKYFTAESYEIASNASTYTITATFVTPKGEELTYALDQDGDEVGSVITQ